MECTHVADMQNMVLIEVFRCIYVFFVKEHLTPRLNEKTDSGKSHLQDYNYKINGSKGVFWP